MPSKKRQVRLLYSCYLNYINSSSTQSADDALKKFKTLFDYSVRLLNIEKSILYNITTESSSSFGKFGYLDFIIANIVSNRLETWLRLAFDFSNEEYFERIYEKIIERETLNNEVVLSRGVILSLINYRLVITDETQENIYHKFIEKILIRDNTLKNDLTCIIKVYVKKMMMLSFSDFIDNDFRNSISVKYNQMFINILFDTYQTCKWWYEDYFNKNNFISDHTTNNFNLHVLIQYKPLDEKYLFSIINIPQQKEHFKKLLKTIPRQQYIKTFKQLEDVHIYNNVRNEMLYQHEMLVQFGEYDDRVASISDYILTLMSAELLGNEPLIRAILERYDHDRRLRQAINELPEKFIRRIYHLFYTENKNNSTAINSKFAAINSKFAAIRKNREILTNYLYNSKIGRGCVDLIMQYTPF